MPTIRQGIYQLLSAVEITTKELGKTHVEPWLSQRLVIDAVSRGLAEDAHTFVVLKCRQVACTTVCSVIELFWALTNPGTQGAIIADRTDNLERLRRIFADLLETLPPEWRGQEHRLIANNRTGLAFANRSVIDLLAAGSNPDLGASRALNMLHATECSLWKSLAGVESLQASLARQNPNRLFIFESIANGFNWYYNFCKQAKTDRHMRFIFCGFWSSPSYTIPKTDPDYRIYWDGRLTEDEIKKARYVKEHYNVTVKPEAIAWWRRESEYKQQEYMLRHYPWTEVECFISSGSGFFPASRTLEIGETLAQGAPYKGYKYTFEEQFLASKIEQTTVKDDVTLRVWEPPEPNGVYAIGIDPSGGGGGDANDHAIEVCRCYADRLVQVAEYQSNRPYTYQLAWVLAHLAGAYRTHMANIEISGIGAAVLPELRNLRLMAERGMLMAEPAATGILNIIGNVRWYLYSRPDTLSGPGNVFAWKTNQDNKAQIYSELRDSIMKPWRSDTKTGHTVEIRSLPLLQQMQAIVVEEGGWIGAGPDTGEHDDLMTAFVLSHHTYVSRQRDWLLAANMTWENVHAKPSLDPEKLMSELVSRHWQKINRKAAQRRDKF